MTSGCRGTPYIRRYRREMVYKPAIPLKKSWGGYHRTLGGGGGVIEIAVSVDRAGTGWY